VVVDAERERKTTKTTPQSERRSALKKRLTEPTLLEMSDNPNLPGVEEREAALSYQISNREPWNKKPPIIISKDAAPIISFPMKNPTIGTVNTA
jgi:hypothetical protein